MSHKLSPDNVDPAHQDDRLWSEYFPKLQRYCQFLAQNTWDGDDIAQETYLKALKYHKQQMSSALLTKIAYHHWIDLLRKRKNETTETDLVHSIPDSTNQLDNMTHAVDLLLNHFTPKQAVIFMLKEAFQYQLKEIAELMHTTEMAIKASLHRVKKRLEKEEQLFSLEAFWDEEERERLSDIFYEALKNQDPAILIESIPTITNMNEVSRVQTRKRQAIQTHSPSSTLRMAA
ncbi:sigma-70 family RNA polymerase sigma factor [Neobacillus sp. OS1-2]|uniref:sigma-70 family RNA polymerase sigma factor n=1 Tax=Neobacillus sp. OS1-2 TaxID=3070680 RepID=UPI0027E0CA9B|nr:sigma-70 family RNA polymerase sigma factor [Neobacillus sp. OS1-2]WML39452.1 sigma-70 family RNA polymerase sigma factor [Neobacillus sp. OS1-2]